MTVNKPRSFLLHNDCKKEAELHVQLQLQQECNSLINNMNFCNKICNSASCSSCTPLEGVQRATLDFARGSA